MKFTIDAALLAKVLRKVNGVVEKRNVMPILASVLIEAHGNSVTFRATDLEIGVEITETDVLVADEGSVIVPVEKVLKLTRKLKGQVSLKSAKDDTLVITCPSRRSRTTLAGSPVDEFPAHPPVPGKQVEVDAGALGTAIATVLHACSKDETRYNLNGVYIVTAPTRIVKVVATDGHRLVVASAGSMKLPWKGGIIVPLKGAQYLVNSLKGEDTVEIAYEKSALRVSGGSWVVSIRLIEGEFPNYNQVIPKKVGDTLIVDKKEFSDALATANEMAAERSRAVKLVISAGGLELHTSNPDFGDSVVECPCGWSGSVPRTLAFNGRYLTDAVAAVCNGRVRIDFSSPKAEFSPIRISGSEEYPFCIVMPMRV
ncbi:hypothetical protein LCGC14_2265200 [marine sediment metagenome]|uniref:Beta sliding clamp n=1 Tax=marine sediment metagenome TaxID=412755 RepID=A0A0F9CYK4_9ZZZZ